jgi:hypothetical protein
VDVASLIVYLLSWDAGAAAPDGGFGGVPRKILFVKRDIKGATLNISLDNINCYDVSIQVRAGGWLVDFA